MGQHGRDLAVRPVQPGQHGQPPGGRRPLQPLVPSDPAPPQGTGFADPWSDGFALLDEGAGRIAAFLRFRGHRVAPARARHAAVDDDRNEHPRLDCRRAHRRPRRRAPRLRRPTFLHRRLLDRRHPGAAIHARCAGGPGAAPPRPRAAGFTGNRTDQGRGAGFDHRLSQHRACTCARKGALARDRAGIRSVQIQLLSGQCLASGRTGQPGRCKNL